MRKGVLPGQAVVVVLLVLGVAATVGLSIISRSVTEVSVSTAEEEASRALEAAEAGVERALGGIVAVGQSATASLPSANASYNVATTGAGGGRDYEVPHLLAAGEVASINLEGYSPDRLWLCWGDGTSPIPAVEVILYYRDPGTGTVIVGREGYDPASRPNGFVAVGGGAGNCSGLKRTYAYQRDLDLRGLGMDANDEPVVLRVRMLYNVSNGQIMAVRAQGLTDAFPNQGTEIVSVGQAGDTTQKLRVVQTNPDLPLVFDSALFSGGSLEQ